MLFDPKAFCTNSTLGQGSVNDFDVVYCQYWILTHPQYRESLFLQNTVRFLCVSQDWTFIAVKLLYVFCLRPCLQTHIHVCFAFYMNNIIHHLGGPMEAETQRDWISSFYVSILNNVNHISLKLIPFLGEHLSDTVRINTYCNNVFTGMKCQCALCHVEPVNMEAGFYILRRKVPTISLRAFIQ